MFSAKRLLLSQLRSHEFSIEWIILKRHKKIRLKFIGKHAHFSIQISRNISWLITTCHGTRKRKASDVTTRILTIVKCQHGFAFHWGHEPETAQQDRTRYQASTAAVTHNGLSARFDKDHSYSNKCCAAYLLQNREWYSMLGASGSGEQMSEHDSDVGTKRRDASNKTSKFDA